MWDVPYCLLVIHSGFQMEMISQGQCKAPYQGVSSGEHMVEGRAEGQGLPSSPFPRPLSELACLWERTAFQLEGNYREDLCLSLMLFPPQSCSHFLGLVRALRKKHASFPKSLLFLTKIPACLFWEATPEWTMISKYILFTLSKKLSESLLASGHQETQFQCGEKHIIEPYKGL